MKKSLFLLLPLLAVITACSDSGSDQLKNNKPHVIEVTLDDGREIECIWISTGDTQSSKGGLDCDWHPVESAD